MMNLEKYQERRDILCAWYDRVIKANELLQADVDALQEAKSNLSASRFVVAICGEMNSGKSTLLNALLFENEVLPSHVTTMTAKIALMEGDTTERIEATLYTPDEFQQVKDACKLDKQAEPELTAARNTARTQGLKERDLLTKPARVLSVDGLQGLAQYAAVCDQGGIYSIYVKSVRLWADRPWLHEVTVADTPGTGDPNPERDKITREWIKRADAVVYVTFAGQAGLTGSDVKFIDEHLAHIDPRRRIIAVNKCDGESNTEAIRNNIQKAQSSDDLRKKNLFGDDDQIVLVSGLGALVSAMQQAGRQLSEDMEWHAEQLSAKGYLDPERHGLEKLRALVEQRIIATKGDGIIEAHQRRLDSVFESAVRRLSQNVTVLENHINAVKASRDERTEERKKVGESITFISKHVVNERTKLEKKLDAHGVLDECIDEVKKEVARGFAEDIKQVGNIDNLGAQASWSLQEKLYAKRKPLTDGISGLVHQIEDALNEAENRLSDTLLASGLGTRMPQTHLLPVSARTICKDAEAKLIENLDQNALSEVVHDAANWFQRFFNTRVGRKHAVEGLQPVLEKKLGKTLNNISEHALRELNTHGQKALKSMEASCRDILERRQELLEELEKEDLSDENRAAQLNEKLKEANEQKLQVEKLQAEYGAEANV